MKTISQDYKDAIKTMGREIDAKITYTLNNETIELGGEMLNSITPHYEGGILKSVMKQLDIDSNQDIPIGTILNAQFGVFTGSQYEYISFGNFIVYSSEKQEDLKSYKIVCYDKMLYAMKDYESFATYPISVRNYINALCTHLNLTFANISDNFVNYDREIPSELFLDANGDSLNYTFRDVLDQLAQITASTICINDDDELEIRYINDTEDTIDGEFLKDINVNFGEMYGPINTITFKRSADADAISRSIPSNLSDDLKNEIAISDNQFLNDDNRGDYIDAILNQLYGLEYYLNDYVSTGITYYDLCDKYNVEIEDEEGQITTYSCIMFNDEIQITQGLVENVHTDRPSESETDYNTTTKDDRNTTRTSLIVDKVNGQITSVVENVEEQNSKISQITQSVDDINAKIQAIADITTSGETIYGSITLSDINESEPIMIKVHPTTTNISYLYPHSVLYPSSTLYTKVRLIRFYNTSTDEVFDYELPDDLLIYDENTYDEFYLDYENEVCQITKRCGYNADGSVYALANEQVHTYTYPVIYLTTGDYTISVLGYGNAYITCRLMASNIYTTQFATRAEVRSEINQSANEITSSVAGIYATKNELTTAQTQIKQTTDAITLEVNNTKNDVDTISGQVELKVDKDDNDQIVSMLNASADQINITSNRLVVNSSNFTLSATGEMGAEAGLIGGWNITPNTLWHYITPPYDYSQTDIDRIYEIRRGQVSPTADDYAKYDFNQDGEIGIDDLLTCRKLIIYDLKHSRPGKIIFDTNDWLHPIKIISSSNETLVSFGPDGVITKDIE